MLPIVLTGKKPILDPGQLPLRVVHRALRQNLLATGQQTDLFARANGRAFSLGDLGSDLAYLLFHCLLNLGILLAVLRHAQNILSLHEDFLELLIPDGLQCAPHIVQTLVILGILEN